MWNLSSEINSEGAICLKLVGEATIEHVIELRQALLEALGAHEQVQVDCAAVETIDFFTVQLFCSAHRTAVSWKKQLIFSGAPAPAVAAGVHRTGFARHRGCSHCPPDVACLWL